MADDMIEAAKKLSASNATKLAYALLWCVPIWCLLPFVAAALYSSPSTDDFCLSGHNSKEALAAVSQYYFNVTGRLPALMIITLPSLISRRMGLDLFALYPIFNVGVIITFVAAMIGGATMLLRTANHFIGILLGLLLCAFILSIVPNISEFIYWVTGEACYLTATIGAALFSAWVSRIVLERQRIDAVSLTAAIALCALTSMMNEFTVFFLLGTTTLSLLFRLAVMRRDAQVGAHLAIILAIVLSYCVVLFSPSNAIRLTAFPRARDIGASLETAWIYVLDYSFFLAALPAVQNFGILLVCFGLATSKALSPRTAAQYVLFAVAMLVLGALWVFTSYFIGTYSTGDVLALRARNEVVAVATVVFAISIVSVVQAVAGAVLQFQKREMPRTAMVLALLLAAYGTSLIRAIREAPTYSLLNEEWPQLAQYWRESSARNDLLSTTQETDVVVPRRTVTPRLLIGDELKETTPYQLPNDCIARFYGKKTVLLAHQ